MFPKSHLRTRVLSFLLTPFFFFNPALFWKYLPLSGVEDVFTNSSVLSWNISGFHLFHMIAAIPAFLSAASLQPLFVCSQFLPLLLPNFCEVPRTSCWSTGAPVGNIVWLCKTKCGNKSIYADHESTANVFFHRRNESLNFPTLFHPETWAAPSRSLQGAISKPLLGSISSDFKYLQHRQVYPNQPSRFVS